MATRKRAAKKAAKKRTPAKKKPAAKRAAKKKQAKAPKPKGKRTPAQRLAEEQQTYAVTELAMFRSPQQVVNDMIELWPELAKDPPLDRSHIQYYNPASARSAGELAKKWVTLFNATRARWQQEHTEVPIGNRRARLEGLQDNVDTLRELIANARNGDARRVNPVLIKDLLSEIRAQLVEAEKITGDAYTNRRKVEVSDPRKVLKETLGLSDADLDALEAGE